MNVKGLETLHLKTENTQLSLVVLETGHVVLAYLGKKIPTTDLSYLISEIPRASYLADADRIKDYKLEQMPLIYPGFGNPDLGLPAHQEVYGDGSRISDFRYLSHRYESEKEEIKGLPFSCSSNVRYLVVVLEDTLTKNQLYLKFTAFIEQDVFSQSVEYHNLSGQPVVLQELSSLHLSLLTDQWNLITLNGAWGRENQLNRRPLTQGFQGTESRRGASGHGQNPFVALASPQATEQVGEVIGTALIYSGNFKATAEVDMHQNTRLQLGIHPFEFSWELLPGKSFQSPEAVFLYTDQGLNQLSQLFHRFVQDCVIQSPLKQQERPIIINNWEATYFDYDREKLLSLAGEAAEVGAELFVLDDGWFGNREDETSSLGDWYPNEEKLGGDLLALISDIHQLGLKFGLWLEPEMISENSQLYRQHPDWAIQVPNRKPQSVRHQYVLDLTKNDVQNYLIQTIDELLVNHPIDYIKWDMNRNITDNYSSTLSPERQPEFSHRYILGLYHVLEEITKRHPKVLFESCAGGGGRFDLGMLYYTPQIWTSDDTDPIARLSIQQGTSLIYPPVTMGGHISASPNHQVGRYTPLASRAAVAQQGNFGLELDLMKLTATEKQKLSAIIAQYKKDRQTLQFGRQIRLAVYDPKNEVAWQKINDQTGASIVTHINCLSKPNTIPKRLKLLGLEPHAHYQIDRVVRTGAELMSIGLAVPRPSEDFFATQWRLEKIKKEQPLC
ncbi:alpha-galactosidase [Candidatus Enterococcus clewellii]|uniref:Alpha-galactosidase n=1 Tax=Candidatus Enterococcus clewellii TaxID=1834193 RepID=A0A242KCH8_9ENTE|nr:alpha-galactosidase [Enterococcus sp. 9E7_DIV0242]OTP18871.1 hypothetical protein A5888_000685 [Enterococcus sp. 9E7_DIV0242]